MRVADGNKARAAGGVDGEARSGKTEHVRDAACMQVPDFRRKESLSRAIEEA